MNIKLYSTEKATARTLNIAISEGLSRIFHKKLHNFMQTITLFIITLIQ